MTAVWLVRVHYGLPAEEPFRDYTRFAVEVRKRAPLPDEVLFFRTEAHALAFHVGRPMAVLIEWKDLETSVSGSGSRDAWSCRSRRRPRRRDRCPPSILRNCFTTPNCPAVATNGLSS